jgi:hypothetical protein
MERYPRAEGQALDMLAANMGITRLTDESDDQMRARIVAYIREPQAWLPIGRRQKVAIWLHGHGMPTFAHWLYPGYYFRSTGPRFLGEMPPRWVMERDVDGGFSHR